MTAAVAVLPAPKVRVVPGKWADRKLCTPANAELFYPGRGEYAKLKRAQRICRRCPVSAECLDYALEIGEVWEGVWGGLSPLARRIERDHRTAAESGEMAAR